MKTLVVISRVWLELVSEMAELLSKFVMTLPPANAAEKVV